MNVPKLACPTLSALVLGLPLLMITGCRNAKKPEHANTVKYKVVVAPELMSNRLAKLDGVVYQHYRNSPIHWQPWSLHLFERAKKAKRLIFCVVADPLWRGFHEAMNEMSSNPQLVDVINSDYIPVLVDANQDREMGILSNELSMEVGRSNAYPFLMWMGYNRAPVAFTPTKPGVPGGFAQIFNQSHAMIEPMWEDDVRSWMKDGSKGYVLTNSAMDLENRLKRWHDGIQDREFIKNPHKAMPGVVRQLVSEYDTDLQNFSTTSSLLPTSAMKFLSSVAMRPNFPGSLSLRSKAVVQQLLNVLLPSPMFDPLDGGAFSRRSGRSWMYPSFVKNAASQAEIADTLIMAYQATGDQRALDKALELIGLLETHYRNSDGLFVLSPTDDSNPAHWMWTINNVRNILGDQDADWWIKATGMKDIGNLPLDVDPDRKLFRKNALGMKMTLPQIASMLSISDGQAKQRFDEVRAKLLAVRESRLHGGFQDRSPHLESNLRMVSCYVRAYRVTLDHTYADKALALLGKTRSMFERKDGLWLSKSDHSPETGSARAFQYGLAIQAALDAGGLSGGEAWNQWATKLMGDVQRKFIKKGVLYECESAARVVGLPIEDYTRMTQDTSTGLMAMAISRMQKRGLSVPDGMAALLLPLPKNVNQYPAAHCDKLRAALFREYPLPGKSAK